MSCWLKPLSFMLALAASVFFTASCGSSKGSSQVRVLNAIPDGQEVDVEVNGTKDFSQLSFESIAPTSQPSYTKVPSGSVTFEAFLTGTSTSARPRSTFTLNNGTQSTVILTGLNSVILGTFEPTAVPFTDNNKAPASGSLEFRIINASPSSPGGMVDVYFEPNPFDGNLQGLDPQISGLGYQQAKYQSVMANAQGSGIAVLVTASGAKTPLIQHNYSSPTTGGTISTLVLVDVAHGGQMSQLPILLNDLF